MSLICVPRESVDGERRVAATPQTAQKMIALGHTVRIESGAGVAASFSDAAYEAEGVEVLADTSRVWSEADIMLKVRGPSTEELGRLKRGAILISFIWPGLNPDLLRALAGAGVTTVAMDAVPRLSRSQKMDALSSMANIAGYRAVIEAAHLFGRFFTGQITAAGRTAPAKVLVIGAGVAGLSAVGTAMSLGAIVRAFDTRPVVKDQVCSMGAEFLELSFEEDGAGTGGYAKTMSPEFIEAEMELFMEQAREVDIIITTALIPGKPSPELITEEMLKAMKPGSVLVDLAAERGGNCRLTVADAVTEVHGVKIVGYTDLPSRLPAQASQMYGTNVFRFVEAMTGEDGINVDLEDEVIRGSVVTHSAEVTWPPPAPAVSHQDGASAPADTLTPSTPSAPATQSRPLVTLAMMVLVGAGLLGLGRVAPPEFVGHFTVFILSCFIGWQVVWNVTAALHTPLMSVTNAISGIIVLGAMLELKMPVTSVSSILAAVAILLASINVAGGFLVTQRMLRMFQRGSSDE